MWGVKCKLKCISIHCCYVNNWGFCAFKAFRSQTMENNVNMKYCSVLFGQSDIFVSCFMYIMIYLCISLSCILLSTIHQLLHTTSAKRKKTTTFFGVFWLFFSNSFTRQTEMCFMTGHLVRALEYLWSHMGINNSPWTTWMALDWERFPNLLFC